MKLITQELSLNELEQIGFVYRYSYTDRFCVQLAQLNCHCRSTLWTTNT